MNYYEKDNNTFNKDYFESAVELFIKKSKNKKESRYKSWEYCYNFFHSVHEKISNKNVSLTSPFGECVIDGQKWTNKDQLSLHLAFYMASWGMYRGSSFLLQNDYTIYYGVVDTIFEDKYKELWDDKKLFSGNIENKISSILNLYKDIQNALYRFKEFYDTKSYFCNDIEDKTEYNPKFLTIITKIILGTIGCFPALDRNFKYGFGISDGSKKSDFVEQTIRRVFDLVLNKKEEIESALEEIKCDELPPIMKSIDMYYFIKGQEDFFLHNLGFKEKNFGGIVAKDITDKIDNFNGSKTPKTKDAAKFLYNNICKDDIYIARDEILYAYKKAQKTAEFVRDNYKEEDDKKFKKD